MLEYLPGAVDARPPVLARPKAEAPGRRGTRSGGARRRPGQVVVLGFAGAIAVGTLLLRLPVSSADQPATWLEALFTATSAVCVTGLVVVDTASHWSTFGQVVVLALIQLGGLGIMTVATLLGLLISRRLGMRSRLVAATSTHTVDLGDVRAVLLGVVRVSAVVEVATAVLLVLRLVLGYGETWARAAWLGGFHAVSAFNNAGFSLHDDSLVRYTGDPWIGLPVSLAVVLGGIGFPVILELRRQHGRASRWSLHTKITLLTSGVLLAVGTLFVVVAEWSNPRTLGPLGVPAKLLAAFVESTMTRTAGFNGLDTAALSDGTWLGMDVLMFIGGGSGGTAGGIKVTTFAVLAYVIWSELRGDPDVTTFDRRIATTVQRQAQSVALLSVAAVVVSTIVIALGSSFELDRILFEVISAFATVGLSTGLTAELAPAHQLILVVLMFVGRLGPVTLGTALALRERQRLFRHPEGAPVVG